MSEMIDDDVEQLGNLCDAISTKCVAYCHMVSRISNVFDDFKMISQLFRKRSGTRTLLDSLSRSDIPKSFNESKVPVGPWFDICIHVYCTHLFGGGSFVLTIRQA